MLEGWVIITVAVAYLCLLFLVASWGDRRGRRLPPGAGRPMIYALSLGVYCTSWTFFGSVGLASTRGFDFLTIYIGPILVFLVGYPLLRRVIQLAKAEHITSVADFIAARYGKSQTVAAVVTLIAVTATIPYIALQLKAVSSSVVTLIGYGDAVGPLPPVPVIGDLALLVALIMALFAVLFGTRHINATEHQEGLMLAIAAESAVKLVAFLVVGAYITYGLNDGVGDLIDKATAAGHLDLFTGPLDGGTWIAQILLSSFAIMMLPRQFHVTVVENNSDGELRRAAWIFPLYLVAINLFVAPIALAGLLAFGSGVPGDNYVLALPMLAGNGLMTLIAFIGGLSAATAMVIVASVALSIMISNDFVIPFLLRQRTDETFAAKDMGKVLLNVRRMAILGVLLCAYVYHRFAGNTGGLASIGLLSFAAIAQLGPAFLLGLVWRRGTARGAIAGMSSGFAVWGYTLLLPNLVASGVIAPAILVDGPFGITMLRPQSLFNFAVDPFTHGVFWSLAVNLVAFVFVSLMRPPAPIERMQATVFVPTAFTPAPSYRRWRTSTTVYDLKSTVARYIGPERADRSFARFARENEVTLEPLHPASVDLLRFAEQLLAGAIGAASSRLVLTLLLKRSDPSTKAAMKLLDDASEAIQYSRDLLQIGIDQVAQGIAVYDADLRLVCWNRRFRDLQALPAEFGQVGTPLTEILRFNAERGFYGAGRPESLVDDRIGRYITRMDVTYEALAPLGTVLEIRTSPMPDGGFVMTTTDITERIEAERALARANESLERRVVERTEALTVANAALARAKAAADEANIGKTRFLAAASHDILQPLNAARLYTTALVERLADSSPGRDIRNVDASLEAVEEILGAVLDISRLDTGSLKPEIGLVRIDDILGQLGLEFAPAAAARGLKLTVVRSGLTVRSDRRLLRRLLQNLISNAIKYTPEGRVLVGCRRRGGRVLVQVYDTGLGIPEAQQKVIFEEFHRLDQGARIAPGLGLGLSIVERIARVLDHAVRVRSAPGRGSLFEVALPAAPALPRSELPAEPARIPAADLAGIQVLCIDNEPAILAGMATLLGGWGCEVLTAANAREATRLLHETRFRPDVMLVDYHLDEGTGVEAIAHLRWRFGDRIPAVLVTANRSPDLRAEAQDKGIGLMFKPVKPAALRAQLAQYRASRNAAE
ncbi:PAS domain-containing hybrid sensor histidine kinase/response regulator [Methylobrevis albus]|uniref:histidine kinase n=1 Tax=Methylobrevis albus TaxID=2793297 RepID=A0A931I163_9HYPH|nr:PAS domain-containing hybrid sensor histidine kinase/response regulator [Methylobrevis albus]MBH0237479.1 PAS-domain containing protein [Methylobrevis albus]